MMIPAQCRAGRALLSWSQTDLATASGVSLRAIASFEKSRTKLMNANLKMLQAALEAAGVEFTNGEAPGVRVAQSS